MSPLETAIEIVGNQQKLARLLGVTSQAISQWRSGVRRIPPERAAQIETICDGRVKARDLLPEFPWPKAA